ncbi:hypothetical protein RB196_34445 [Streptomyces sp. PmtA]|uniref:hypothetical protein n=1 Tax=Streptomyces sp. PmtA TaxID=3074275 RepID=UPI0030142F5A
MNHPTPPPYDPQSPQPGYGYPQQPAAGGTVPRPLHKTKRIYAGGLYLLLIGTGCGAAMGDEGGGRPPTPKRSPGRR